MKLLSATLLSAIIFPGTVLADSSEPAPVPSKESANYSKAEKLLPGEEVITPTGQRLKVWSTQGPVEVSKAPEPFDDEAAVDEDIHIVVDGMQIRKQNQIGNPPAIAPRKDSFSHGSTE